MANPKCGTGEKRPTNSEIAACVEAIGQLHHALAEITRSLTKAKKTARTFLDHCHAIPGGVPQEAAVAFAKLRLEVAHDEALSLETLRSLVEAVHVPEVHLSMTSGAAPGQTPHRDQNPGDELLKEVV
jgi:hypothetical protein